MYQKHKASAASLGPKQPWHPNHRQIHNRSFLSSPQSLFFHLASFPLSLSPSLFCFLSLFFFSLRDTIQAILHFVTYNDAGYGMGEIERRKNVKDKIGTVRGGEHELRNKGKVILLPPQRFPSLCENFPRNICGPLFPPYSYQSVCRVHIPKKWPPMSQL